MSSRREFLAVSAVAGVGLGLGGRPDNGHGEISGNARRQGRDSVVSDVEPAPRSLRLLFLGGTGFLGPAEVEYALARGHTVTLFNRGRTNTHLFPDVEKLVLNFLRRDDKDDDATFEAFEQSNSCAVNLISADVGMVDQ